MTAVDAIFFDVDGTLVDARIDIVKAMNHILRELGVEEKPFDLIVSYIGTGVRDLVAKSLGTVNKSLVTKGIEMFSDFYEDHSHDEARPYPHVKETLEFFRDKRKFILTNRYAKFADATLRGLGLRQYFEKIIGGDDENCLKPSACVLDKILPKLKIDKSKALIVGDMAIDIMTGKNSGIKTCWVTYGLGKPEEVKGLKPDYVIDDIAELKRIIK